MAKKKQIMDSLSAIKPAVATRTRKKSVTSDKPVEGDTIDEAPPSMVTSEPTMSDTHAEMNSATVTVAIDPLTPGGVSADPTISEAPAEMKSATVTVAVDQLTPSDVSAEPTISEAPAEIKSATVTVAVDQLTPSDVSAEPTISEAPIETKTAPVVIEIDLPLQTIITAKSNSATEAKEAVPDAKVESTQPLIIPEKLSDNTVVPAQDSVIAEKETLVVADSSPGYIALMMENMATMIRIRESLLKEVGKINAVIIDSWKQTINISYDMLRVNQDYIFSVIKGSLGISNGNGKKDMKN